MWSKFVMQSKKKGDQLLSHLILQVPFWLKEISHLQCIQNCAPVSPALGLALLQGSFFGIMFSALSSLSFSSVFLFLQKPSSLCHPPCFVAPTVLMLASFSLYLPYVGSMECCFYEWDDEKTLWKKFPPCFWVMVTVSYQYTLLCVSNSLAC